MTSFYYNEKQIKIFLFLTILAAFICLGLNAMQWFFVRIVILFSSLKH